MRTDYDIHQPFPQPLQSFLLLGRSTEPAHHLDSNWKIFHPLNKGIVMLLGQNRSRDQIDHLLAVLYCLKRGPQGDFCFSVSHVAADQTVHDLWTFHIRFYSVNGV